MVGFWLLFDGEFHSDRPLGNQNHAWGDHSRIRIMRRLGPRPRELARVLNTPISESLNLLRFIGGFPTANDLSFREVVV